MMTDATNRIAQLEAENSQLRAQLDQIRQTSVEKQVEHERLSGRLEDLLDLLPAGVVVIDNRGRVAECNSAAEQLLGQPLKNEPWIAVIQRSFAPRSDDGHEVSLKSGRRVSLSTSTLANESGQLLMLTDQTDTRLLQGRLAHYQRLSEMGRMMASLAHQVRTPLSAALLYAGHLMKPELRPEQRIKFAGKVKSRLENLELQVRDMLIFARGETRLEDRISVAELFRELEDALDMPLHSWDADCDCLNRVPELQLQCNKDSLLGAIMNLVNNALQAGGKGTELVIEAQLVGDKLGIEVRDNGPGMDAELCKKVLEPFYSTKSHGTGLGLAVAQVVAKAHHGEFLLRSQLGVGTQAAFLIPYQTGGQTDNQANHLAGNNSSENNESGIG
ncbi:PAS/PAC sensor signal transduction histidine kinase [Amphritea atlantica]|uniref:histidine kinase n=2 Tax=Amphritea atlantica TaxID=355243 RepID=A0A1H9L944_9GAMM|nr:ATP-binding protein [Amphritea atlantica]SER07890.1 PAS/PAC sensor signal transduction histidine kinase [Amphritea atlantica]